jgi:hypothetical protein
MSEPKVLLPGEPPIAAYVAKEAICIHCHAAIVQWRPSPGASYVHAESGMHSCAKEFQPLPNLATPNEGTVPECEHPVDSLAERIRGEVTPPAQEAENNGYGNRSSF